jgi:hypothetical protein
MLWNDAGIDATFWFRYTPSPRHLDITLRILIEILSSYALTSNAEGPWSEPVGMSKSQLCVSSLRSHEKSASLTQNHANTNQLYGRRQYPRNAPPSKSSTSIIKVTPIQVGIQQGRRFWSVMRVAPILSLWQRSLGSEPFGIESLWSAMIG